VFVVSKGKYFNYSERQSPAIQKMLKNFATATAFKAVNKRLEQEAKNLDKLEKEQRGLKKDKDAYEKEIKRAKGTIEKRQKDLETNAKSQMVKQADILEKKKEINVIKGELGKYNK
jgi:septal ring factor EnvC (AmiA/AmiB activator)